MTATDPADSPSSSSSAPDVAGADWQHDRVSTNDGVAIPVRATARRPAWDRLPAEARRAIRSAAGCEVLSGWSAGTGFTPGFASRLELADGSRVFVKAASSADDALHGWALSDAYREEARKLLLLPEVGSPRLLWHHDVQIGSERWMILGFEYVDGAPPRRPWRRHQLQLVLDKLAAIAPVLADPPAELGLARFSDDFADYPDWIASARTRAGDGGWLQTVEALAGESVERCAGNSCQHLDLRDDNILIDAAEDVWICDWNSVSRAAPWIDLVCVLLSARGDGHDCDAILAAHPLTREVDPRSVDALLALLWLYFSDRRQQPVPPHSPHLRDHQTWYAEVTRGWLAERLSLGAAVSTLDSSAATHRATPSKPQTNAPAQHPSEATGHETPSKSQTNPDG
ncbi:MAG: hypothetical protein H0U28_07350 [Nocardioidaceae bacterium]|nr:hypothetical protein [Nocardioidaceae bacterium]